MVVIKRILILTLWLTSHNVYSQNFLDSSTYIIDTNLVDIKVDKLNNIWLFYPNIIIRSSQDKAYNDTLNLDYSYDKYAVDLAFPLKNLIYNKPKNILEVYNSRWGKLSTLSLDKIDLFQPSFVQFSADENYWILDQSSNNFQKINETGVIKMVKKNPFVYNYKFYFPTILIDFKHYLVAFDKDFGLFVTDNFGSLTQALMLDSISSIHRFQDKLLIEKSYKLEEMVYNEIERNLKFTGRFIVLNSKLISIQIINKKALILLENKRLYTIDNYEKLFRK